MKISRISPKEAHDRFARGEPVTFVDCRNPTAWAESRVRLPGARRLPVEQASQGLPGERPAGPIVTYCT